MRHCSNENDGKQAAVVFPTLIISSANYSEELLTRRNTAILMESQGCISPEKKQKKGKKYIRSYSPLPVSPLFAPVSLPNTLTQFRVVVGSALSHLFPRFGQI